jgi:acid stress chaperone HdeB
MSSTTQAQTTIEISKITCAQYNSFKVKDPDKIAIWLSGYYHGLQKNTALEVDLLEDRAEKLKDHCFSHPNAYVMDALKTVFKP